MYEKIVSYFEKNLCIDNIYFRKYYKRWILGLVSILVFALAVNCIFSKLIENLWLKSITVIAFDCGITVVVLVIVYILPLRKIYNGKLRPDWLGWLMREEYLNAINEEKISQMEKFLKHECSIKNTKSLDTIIEMVTQEINAKYKYKNFIDKYFNNTVLPIIIFILTVYFTNNKETQLTEIFSQTIVAIISILFVMYFIQKIRELNITPVNKGENLIELKRVLNNIKIKWNQ